MKARIKNAFGSTPDVLIGFLNGIIDREFQKPDDEINMNLVDECLEAITRLDSLISPNQAASYSAFQAEFCEKAVQASHPLLPVLPGGSEFGIYVSRKRKDRNSKRRLGRRFAAALIAAAITASLLTVGVVAKSAGFDFGRWIEEILNLKPGESTELDGFTVFKGENRERFDSIEEFLNEEKLDILYPSVLPENVICKNIIVYEVDCKTTYSFNFSDKSYYYEISEDVKTFEWENFEIFTVNDIDFYLRQVYEQKYQAVFTYNGYQCIVEATDYADIISIISNMKGRQK